MKRFFVICFFLCCCFIHIAAAKVDTLTVYSQAMKKDVNSLVILPDSYPVAERFPTIYLLHGYSDAWNSGWLRYCDGLENLIDQYRIIVICPDGGFSSWYFDSPEDQTYRYETFITGELIPAVDSAYNTIADRTGCGISGNSMGGHNADFTERDVLKYLTTIAPDDNSNGSSQGRGTIQIRSIEKPSSSLVIDGLIFNKGQGGPNLENKEVYTQETNFIYFDGVAGKVNNLNVFIRNCTFVNGPNTTICGLLKGSLTVDNCAFINNRVITMDVRGPDPNAITKVNFLNRITDLTIPGGGMLTRVKVEDFDDVEAIAECSGNKSLTDPALFKGKIDEPYLNGFLSVSYKETTSYNPNSAANTFRSAMGMNMTGTMSSSVSMCFNRYPWQKALDVFGAVPGCGAQIPR